MKLTNNYMNISRSFGKGFKNPVSEGIDAIGEKGGLLGIAMEKILAKNPNADTFAKTTRKDDFTPKPLSAKSRPYIPQSK